MVAPSALCCERRSIPDPGSGKLKLKGYPYPFFFRHGASDVRVIRQIFLKEEYRELRGKRTCSQDH